MRIQFQASLFMIHISQDSVSCRIGNHDNESVVVLFINHLYKSYMSQSLIFSIRSDSQTTGMTLTTGVRKAVRTGGMRTT